MAPRDDEGSTTEIATVGADGTGATVITNDSSTDYADPTWSPDGTMIAFSANADGDSDFFWVRADRGAVHALTSGVWMGSTPAGRS
jgi:Tol biopolymer transport system component